MFSIKQESDALDLTNSAPLEHEESFSSDGLPKKTTYDSGFVDTGDENNASMLVKQEGHHHYHSTPLRPQQIHPRMRHPSTSSSTCSSPTRLEQDCRNTRFLGSRAVAVLNHWFQANREYPYPDDERTEQLANEAGITQKQVKKWFANKRVRSQMCYKPLYRSRKSRDPCPRAPPTNFNYIINHNNLAPAPPPALFNPMASSMMMLMMQQHFMSTMMAAAVSSPAPPPPKPTKPNVDRITRFWL